MPAGPVSSFPPSPLPPSVPSSLPLQQDTPGAAAAPPAGEGRGRPLGPRLGLGPTRPSLARGRCGGAGRAAPLLPLCPVLCAAPRERPLLPRPPRTPVGAGSGWLGLSAAYRGACSPRWGPPVGCSPPLRAARRPRCRRRRGRECSGA